MVRSGKSKKSIKKDKDSAAPSAGPPWWGVGWSLAVSVFLVVMAWPLYGRLFRQVDLMTSAAQVPLEQLRSVYRDATRLESQQHSFAAIDAYVNGRWGFPVLQSVRQRQDFSGQQVVAAYIKLLMMAEEPDPSAEQELADVLRQLDMPPLNEQPLALPVVASAMGEELDRQGFSPRQTAALVHEVAGTQSFQFVRQANAVLNALADRWEGQGRVEEAVLARRVLRQFLAGVIDANDRPQVVLPAARYLAVLMRRQGQEAQADRADDFVRRWQYRDYARRSNLLPMTRAYPLAGDAHRAVLTTAMMSAGWILAASAVFVGIIVWGCVVLLTQVPPEHQPRSRGAGYGAWAVLWGLFPLPAYCIVIYVISDEFAWLISLPTVPALLLLPVGTWFMIRWAGRWGWPVSGDAIGRRSRWPWVGAVGLATIVMACAVMMPREWPEWRPDYAVRLLRSAGLFGGLWLAFVLAGWTVADIRRRKKTAQKPGVFARAQLRLAVSMFLVMVVLSLPLFWVNYRRDQLHARAFANALQHPIEDRLGPDWRVKYFSSGHQD